MVMCLCLDAKKKKVSSELEYRDFALGYWYYRIFGELSIVLPDGLK